MSQAAPLSMTEAVGYAAIQCAQEAPAEQTLVGWDISELKRAENGCSQRHQNRCPPLLTSLFH